MARSVHAAVKRRDAACSEMHFQLPERSATCIAEHQIERFKSKRRNVGYLCMLVESLQRHWRVEIVEEAQTYFGIEHQFCGGSSIGTIGSDDRTISIGQLLPCIGFNIVPVGV